MRVHLLTFNRQCGVIIHPTPQHLSLEMRIMSLLPGGIYLLLMSVKLKRILLDLGFAAKPAMM